MQDGQNNHDKDGVMTHESVVKVIRLLNNLEKKYEDVPRQSRDRLILLHFKAIMETVKNNYAMLMAREIDSQNKFRDACCLLKTAVGMLESQFPSMTKDDVTDLLKTSDRDVSDKRF
jgi:hypothetical protein